MDAIKEGMLATAKAAEAAARIGERLFGQNIPSVMNFSSQICTTREQSQRLIALGLKKETADMRWERISEKYGYYPSTKTPYASSDIPAWSLHRLWELANIKHIILDSQDEIAVLYDEVIMKIEQFIEEGYFPKEYLEE